MKTKELINLLKKQDPDKEVLIQQGEEWDYMKAYSVEELEIFDMDGIEEDEIIDAVVIKYA